LRVWITRDWDDKTYEVWGEEPKDWYISNYQGDDFIFHTIPKELAKKTLNLPRHLRKKEICEGTMEFKVKVK